MAEKLNKLDRLLDDLASAKRGFNNPTFKGGLHEFYRIEIMKLENAIADCILN